MTKIALCGDMHWGARNDSEFFLNLFSEFVTDVLIPGCQRHGVTKIIQLGDLMDRRKYGNFLTIKTVKERFFRELHLAGIEVVALLGNHDIFFKNTLEVNSMRLLFDSVPNLRIVDKPTVHPDIPDILMIPWLCDDNREEIMREIEGSKVPYVAGHFEFRGFDMYRGISCEHGDDHTVFSKFKKVYSGHFHTRSGRDNIEYIGTPYEIIWSDHGDTKGFMVLDTETGEETWIANSRGVHLVIQYNEDDVKSDYDFSVIKDRYVKIVVEKSTNQKRLDAFVKICFTQSPHALAVIDTREEETDTREDEISLADKDPLTILVDEIKHRFKDPESSSMVVKSNELYLESMADREVSA